MVSKADILDRISEFEIVGEKAFLKKYAAGRGSVTTWIVHKGAEYPIKAIWAAAHRPPIRPRSFKTNDCEPQVRSMGFSVRKLDKPLEPSAESFSGFCRSIGFPLKNMRWSWCATSNDGRSSLFTIWDNEIRFDGQTYEFWDDTEVVPSSDHGRREILRLLNATIENDLIAYGVKCTPIYPLTVPRKRSSFDRHTLLALRVRREGKKIVGTIVGTITTEALQTGFTSLGSAIDDLELPSLGNELPGRGKYAATYYLRDEKVRREVLIRANGKCEHCGAEGFRKPDGKFYVEAHHIISLAKQGPDTLVNVIALCANHHRQAHFGEDWEQLEGEFKTKLAKLRGK